MALPDYYARNAIAASQVLAGLDEARIAAALGDVRVGIAIGEDTGNSLEGRALLDMLVRLVSRLYPSISVHGAGPSDVIDSANALARRINPNIEFAEDSSVEIVIGAGPCDPGEKPRIFVGSSGWNAMVTTGAPRSLGSSDNPFGAGVAACIAAGNLFRLVFMREDPCLDVDASLYVPDHERYGRSVPAPSGPLGEILLVGAGAIGNATAWALSRTAMGGLVRIVDPQSIDLGNLQRYVLADRQDEGAGKATLAASHFNGHISAEPYAGDFAAFVESKGHSWSRVLLALDTARDRRAAQASLPDWVANAWTQPGDLGVSTHDFLDGACVSCLYLPDRAAEHEDFIIAKAFGVPQLVIQVRLLLYRGSGVPRDMLDAIATARGIPIDRLLRFEGQPVRTLYTEGFCGGAVIPLGEAGTPRQDVHVPLAHQSALAGVLLAAAAVQDALAPSRHGTRVTRFNVLRPIAVHTSQLTAKDPRAICICQDEDYRQTYRQKYPAR